MIKRLTRLSPFVIALLAVVVLGGVASSAVLYRANSGQTLTVAEHSVCKKVRNDNGSDIFVPTNSANEWSLFRLNAPNVVFSDCMTVSAGKVYDGACAVNNGAVSCWDSNVAPTAVMGLSSGVTEISVGSASACVVQDGAAKCWGLTSGGNQYGQLGNGTTVNSLTPVQVTGLTSGVTAVTVMTRSACAIHNGAAKCWGANSFGQLGNGSTVASLTPVQVTGLTSGVTAVVTGYDIACAIHNGAAKCWGSNNSGSLGDGTAIQSTVPVQVTGLTSGVTNMAISLMGGSANTSACAIQGGAVKCWGKNGDNQNDGNTINSLTPLSITGLTSGVTDISLNIYASCAVQNGGLKCWGSNTFNQLGDPTILTSSPDPVSVPSLTSGVGNVSVGPFSACAVHNGVAKCWGAINDSGSPVTSWAP